LVLTPPPSPPKPVGPHRYRLPRHLPHYEPSFLELNDIL
jgi:hypothetical protein